VDDEWLVEQILLGKGAYWNALVTRYRSRLFEKISRIVKNEEDAWEIVENTFINAKANIPSYRYYYLRARNSSVHSIYGEKQPIFFVWLRCFTIAPFLDVAKRMKR
jgi:hypothetical protein